MIESEPEPERRSDLDRVSGNASRPTYKSPASILRPRSVAIIGASESHGYGKELYEQLTRASYGGPVYPVNPRRSTVWDVACYPDLDALPEKVEQVLVTVPAAIAVDVVERAFAGDVSSAVVYARGLGDGGADESRRHGARLKEVLQQTNKALLGPNCLGASSLYDQYFGYVGAPELVDLPRGGVSCVFQSGGTLDYFCTAGAARGLKFSTLVSTGNEMDLDLADFVWFLVEDERTKTIVLFIEGIRRSDAFAEAATAALAAHKPIIVIKTGRSETGRQAARSHTGAIAGDYALFIAFARRYGITVCQTLDDLLETALLFQASRRPRGTRVGWVTNSGGTVDLLLDYLHDGRDPRTPEFDSTTRAALSELIPAGMDPGNPLDAGVPTTDAHAVELCKAVATDPNVDIVAWSKYLPPVARGDAATLAEVVRSTSKPVVGFGRMRYFLSEDALAFQDEVGIPFLQGLPETVRALAALGAYAAVAGSKVLGMPEPNQRVEAIDMDSLATTLEENGLGQPTSGTAADPEGAARVAESIGFPVALKIVSPSVSHKTEIGGVCVGMREPGEVAREAEAMLERLKSGCPDAEVEGFLVQGVVSGVEVLLGARDDAIYGPMIGVGAGGVLVELLEDVSWRALPVEAADAHQMLAELRLRRLLDGYRGAPAADIPALVSAICWLSTFFLGHRHLLEALEINPLMVLPYGQGVRSVDVRMVLRDSTNA